MFKRNISILFLALFISSCFYNGSKKDNSISNTWTLNQNFSWNIVDKEISSSLQNNLNNNSSNDRLEKNNSRINGKSEKSLNKNIINLDKNTNSSETKKNITKSTKKEKNISNDQNVDVIEKDLEKELDSLINLINENE